MMTWKTVKDLLTTHTLNQLKQGNLYFSLLQQAFDTKTWSILMVPTACLVKGKSAWLHRLDQCSAIRGPFRRQLCRCASLLSLSDLSVTAPLELHTSAWDTARSLLIISLGGTTLGIMKWEAELMNRKLL